MNTAIWIAQGSVALAMLGAGAMKLSKTELQAAGSSLRSTTATAARATTRSRWAPPSASGRDAWTRSLRRSA